MHPLAIASVMGFSTNWETCKEESDAAFEPLVLFGCTSRSFFSFQSVESCTKSHREAIPDDSTLARAFWISDFFSGGIESDTRNLDLANPSYSPSLPICQTYDL